MNQNMQIVSFQQKPLEMHIVDGRKCFTAETIGVALEYNDPRRRVNDLFNRYRDEFEEGIDYGVCKIQTPGGPQNTNVFFDTGNQLLAMFSKQPLAKAYRKWAKHLLAGVQSALDAEPAQPESEVDQQQYSQLQAKYIALLEEQNQHLKTQVDQNQPKPRRKPTKITDKEFRDIIEMDKAGHSQNEIARILDRSNGTVSWVLRANRMKAKLKGGAS